MMGRIIIENRSGDGREGAEVIKLLATVFMLLYCLPVFAGGVYKCGKEYTDKKCENAIKLEIDPSRNVLQAIEVPYTLYSASRAPLEQVTVIGEDYPTPQASAPPSAPSEPQQVHHHHYYPAPPFGGKPPEGYVNVPNSPWPVKITHPVYVNR